MPKVKLLFIFGFLLTILTFPVGVLAAPQINASPTTVDQGKTIHIVVTGLPNQSAGYHVCFLQSSANPGCGPGIAGYTQIFIDSSSCIARVPTAPFTSVTTPSCSLQSDGTYTFLADLDTSKLADFIKNSNLNLSFAFYLSGGGVNGVASSPITLNAGTANTAAFSITSVTPSNPKPGDKISINLANTVSGSYTAGISGFGAPQPSNCAGGNCALSFTIPSTISNSPVNIIVTAPDSTQQSTSITLNLPTPVTNTLNGSSITSSYTNPCQVDAQNKVINPSNCTSDTTQVICPNGKVGVATAIGCVPTNPQDLVPAFLKFVLGASGGIALLLMIFGAIGMITSAGNAEALKNARDRFNAAFIGLLFIIFSVLLLQVIGSDILSIPGFA